MTRLCLAELINIDVTDHIKGISGMRWDELVPIVNKLLWNSKNGANTLWWK
jgi:hypothetical protein